MIQNKHLYTKKGVVYPVNSDRQIRNSDDATQIIDDNINNRFARFGTQIDRKYISIEDGYTKNHRTKKTGKMLIGLQKCMVDFKSCDRKFDSLEVSLVYNKSDKHLTIYGGLNTECAAKKN